MINVLLPCHGGGMERSGCGSTFCGSHELPAESSLSITPFRSSMRALSLLKEYMIQGPSLFRAIFLLVRSLPMRE